MKELFEGVVVELVEQERETKDSDVIKLNSLNVKESKAKCGC